MQYVLYKSIVTDTRWSHEMNICNAIRSHLENRNSTSLMENIQREITLINQHSKHKTFKNVHSFYIILKKTNQIRQSQNVSQI